MGNRIITALPTSLWLHLGVGDESRRVETGEVVAFAGGNQTNLPDRTADIHSLAGWATAIAAYEPVGNTCHDSKQKDQPD